MKKLGLVAVVSAMLSIGYAGAEDMDQEVSVKEQFEQLERIHDARYEIVENLADQELARLLWQEQHANYFDMLNLIPFYMDPGEFNYTQPKLLHFQDYSSMREMQDAYLQSLVAIHSYGYVLCSRHSSNQGFVLREGFEFPFRHRLIYSHMTLDNGDMLDIPDVKNLERESADIIHAGESYCYKTPVSAEGPRPVTVSAEFHAELPQELLEFKFSATDVGKTVEQGGYLVTLLEFAKGRYTIEIRAAEGQTLNFGNRDVLAEAVDEHGQYISPRATERAPTTRPQRIDDALEDLFARADQGAVDFATARSELLALGDSFKEEQEGSIYLSRAFDGFIDQALVTLMVYPQDREVVSHELELPVHIFAQQSASEDALNGLPEMPIVTPVYDGRAELRTSIVEFDEQQMKERIKQVNWLANAEEYDPQDGYPGEVIWFSPPVQSDLFHAKEERGSTLHVLGDIEFYDEQGALLFGPGVRRVKSEDQVAYEFKPSPPVGPVYSSMVARLVYDPAKFNAKPARITGTLPMFVAPNTIKDSFAKDQLPDGITLNGNQLFIDYAVFEPREVNEVKDELTERRNQVLVKDDKGYLGEIFKQTLYHPSSGRTAVDIYYFYGEPEVIEIWYKGGTTLTNYEFDIELN